MGKKDMILALIEHYSNGNKAQFANRLGITPQGLSTWIKRESFDIELIFSKCEGISAQWLLTGQGDMFENNNQTKSELFSKNDEINSDLPKISLEKGEGKPYFDVDFLGGFDEVFNSQVSVPDCNVIVPGFEKAQVWCNVTGHSMEPKINHGDIIAMRECSVDDIQYGETYAVVLDTIRTIKILRKGSSPDVLRYVPINTTDFDEQEYPIARIQKIFEVIGSISKFF